MPTIYRIEHKTTLQGPWWHTDDDINNMADYISREYLSFRKHPVVRKDIDGFQSGLHFVGVTEMEQLKEWFNNEFLLYLNDYDFVIRKYKVKTILKGNSGTQVAFNRRNAVQLDEYSVLTILK